MDDLARQMLGKLPLAEACLNLWAWVCSEAELGKVFANHRGNSYESIIKFPVMVYLIANALWNHDGSGRGSFEEGQADGTLEASIQAAFGKLRRLPIRREQHAAALTARIGPMLRNGAGWAAPITSNVDMCVASP